MNLKKIYIAIIGGYLLIMSSCSPYQKALKSEDDAVKYEMAEKLYKSGDYSRSERLFEDIRHRYLGKPQGERVLYMLADSYFKRRKYFFAAEAYEKLVQTYPKSEKAAEATFMEGKSYFMESPRYSLDQEETYKAIDKLQNFIDRYPNSEYIREANNLMLELLTKLQHKSFEIAKGYHKIRDYQAAIKSLDNFLLDNPGTIYKEETMFLKLDSAFELARNSVKSKEKQRFEDAKSICESFQKTFPESQYKEKVDRINNQITEKLKEL